MKPPERGRIVIFASASAQRGFLAQCLLEYDVREATTELSCLAGELPECVVFGLTEAAELDLCRTFSVENASEAIIWLGMDAQLTFVNQSACRLLGYSSEELLRMTVHVIDPKRSKELWKSHCEQLKQEGALTFEADLLRKDGSWVPVEVTVNYMEFGEKVYQCAFLRDITKRKRAEETARKLTRAVEQNSAGVVITDLQAKIEYVNPKYCAITGYSADELIGENPRILKSGNTSKDEYQRLWRTILDGGEWSGELLNRKKSGELFWERVTICSLKESTGQITHFVAIKEDITQQKNTEQMLRENQHRLREQFTELKNYYRVVQASREELRALAGRLQAVREDERTRLAREIHDVLAQELTCLKLEVKALKTALNKRPEAEPGELQRLDEIDKIANLAIESVQKIATELRPVVLDTLGLCAAIEWQMKDFQTRTGIECETRITEECPCLGRDRSTALFRILQECLTNISRHAKATNVEVSLQSRSKQVILTVCDNGRGITAAQLTNPKSIGLVGMRERALLLGGECRITKRRKGGTAVRVRFSLSESEQG